MNILQENQSAISQASFLNDETKTRASGKTARFSALDIQRGLIMMMMAFSHGREYMGSDSYSNYHMDASPAWKGDFWVDFFQQVGVSSIVAGGFFMMMGIGIHFLWHSRLKEGYHPNEVWRYLLTRGAVMVTVQFTIMAFFETISSEHFYLYVGVLYALGICMMLAACCLRLIEAIKQTAWGKAHSAIEYWLPLMIGVGIIIINQLLVFQTQASDISPTLGKILLLLGGGYDIHGIHVDFDFMPFPWFPAVAFGLIIGKIISRRDGKSIKLLQWIALALLASWFLIKTAYLQGIFSWGDYKLLVPGEHLDWRAYFCSSKYPPSLSYFLFAWGINLTGILLWLKLENRIGHIPFVLQPLKTFGQCALFFFICHWYLYYIISILLPAKLSSAGGLLGFWLMGLMLMYPACYFYRNFKMTKSKESLWRMF
ncbi:heparan-alpha-glucosaminide N-acetyltransferase domain-containing protein [Legionella sp. 16cNR16C]|uniref:heparan-alpha-glucosaminide N-acetyltransferase domain-containing protein n=1 Tax=Legionella sp. 16cNR16C TaxID=2905656 RepID=UPI001E2C007D|nr:heparan-alpha-glucosaminide N-acetyltransferase domain-containing protein [Legionella sp. 16cNR16C]MCE3045890.1 heparan-alpha-glucosaminide N-acetyltransferase domain-containing protein [Legionella sp. 16cNR16C]